MQTYIIRRFLLAIPTLVLVTMLVFMLVRFIPGSALDIMIAQMSSTGGETFTDVEGLKHQLGLDVSVPVQYGRWVGIWPNADGKISGYLEGDMGKDLWTGEAITEIIRIRWPVTLELATMAWLLQWGLALPIGVFAATRQDSLLDYSGRLFAIVMLSLPGFWIATMVVVYPSIWWGTMPNIVYVPLSVDPIGNFKQFIIPAFIEGVGVSAMTMRLTRTMMLEVLRADYIRTAWSKGLTENTVLLRHAVKNAFIPVITVMGAQLPTLINGQIIMEQIFALPGMGRLFIDALNTRDYPVINSINTLVAVLILVTNVVVDAAYGLLDPRIRYE
jgi:peptide/nickel transport system permease protein